jgi:phage repressor protein C with HTH and peptisase S24 domain
MIGERIRELRGTETQAQWEARFGVTRNTIRRYESGTNPPDADFIVALCQEYNVSADWLLLEKGSMRLDDSVAVGTSTTDGDYVHIPRFEVVASAGGGAMVHSEQIVDYLSFRADWVRSALGVSVGDLALISVIGDSMEPSLSEGDVVLLDMTTRSVLDGSIYALQLNGGLLVKRIQRMLDGSLVVKSDNARYDTETVSEDKADRIKIIGRVVWVGRRL